MKSSVKRDAHSNYYPAYRKIRSPLLQNPRREIFRNASLDIIDFHRPRFNIDRKISKSSYIKQRLGKNSNLINKMLLYKNIYNDFSFQKAPSFNKNISEIHQMINGKKRKKIKYLDNLFFNSKFPNENLDDIYLIRKNNILFQREKNREKFFHRNNSSGQLIYPSQKGKNIIRNEDSRENETSTNNTNIIKIKKNVSNISNSGGGILMKNNISNISTTTNKSLNSIKFPEIYSNSNASNNEEIENKNNINSSKFSNVSVRKKDQEQNNKNNDVNYFDIDRIVSSYGDGSFITSLGAEKMKYKLNQLMFENGKKNKKINEFEKNILKLKILQIYQKENLEKYLNDDRFNIQSRIDHILQMYKIYENIYEEYQVDLARYINYLWLATSDFEVELQKEIKKKRELDYDVEVLIDKLITRQKELEYLIGLRNFLFIVKNRDKKIIKMNDEYVYHQSKRKEFIDFLLNLYNREPNTMATKYLKRLIEVEELEELLMRNGKSRPITRKSIAKIVKSNEICEDAINPPTPGEIIFDKPEDFFKIIEDLEDRNLCFLKENENLRISKLKLKAELNNYIQMENDDENIQIKKSIISKMRQIKSLKDKNEQLKKRKENLIQLYTKKTDDASKAKLKVVSYNLFTNLNYFDRVNYNNLIIQYKYPGLLFLEKLIYNINAMVNSDYFKSIFKAEECNRYLPYEIFLEIMKTKRENFNDKNQYLILNYNLKLIKLYEYFGENILRKSQQYKINNETLYKKYTEEIQNERKIYNARRIRKLIEKKREDGAKKLIEKWEKKPVINGRKLDVFEKPFYLARNLSQKLLKERKKDTNSEFHNYKLLINSL